MRPLFTFGDLVLDVVARVESTLEVDTDTEGEVRSAPGGSAANFAVWSARLGGAVRFGCRIGDDLLGHALVDDMRREGVELFATYDPVHPTAVLVLFSEGTSRHMMVPRGANHHIDVGDLPAPAIRSAGWLHLTGYSYFWAAPSRAAAHALAIAREASIPISFDPSSAGLMRKHGLALPAGIDVLIPNLAEAAELTGLASSEAAALRLGERVPLVAVKLGADGALLCQGGRVTHVPATMADGPVLDTTGAGDAWGAAFIHGLRRGRAPAVAAAAANQLGARIVTRMGARPSFPIPLEAL
jgi:sugar/nucleoside kinase (ribokinase family)